MKRIGNIFNDLCTIENLEIAYKNAKKGKSKTYGVLIFEKNKEHNLIKLQQDLLNNKFKTSKYTTFNVNENGKNRLIYKLPFYPDRIVHHLLMLKLEKIWCDIFIRDTYACIKTRGIHDGLRRVKTSLKDIENTKYCLKLDIKKFYPSIDHNILKEIIRKKIKDKNILFILDEIIDSAPGVPIGNYLSQYFANLYLSYFDHYMKETHNIKYYHRYADDIVILHKDKNYLHSLLINITNYLDNELKLTINKNYQIFPVADRGIDYLGYKIYHTHVILRKSIKKRMFKSIKKINQENYKIKSIAYNGWLIHCNSINLKNKLIYMNSKKFSELGIVVEPDAFSGKKMSIINIINTEIIVKNYKINKSKFENSKNCLTIEFELNGEDKIVFTGGAYLIKQIEQIKKEDFPFTTKISKINNSYQFT
jgi:hypothetical protein